MQQEELKALLKRGEIEEVIQRLHHYFPKDSLGKYILKSIHSDFNETNTTYLQSKNPRVLDKVNLVIADSLRKVIDRMELLQNSRREADIITQEIIEQNRKELTTLKVGNRKTKKMTNFWMIIVFAVIVTVILLALLN